MVNFSLLLFGMVDIIGIHFLCILHVMCGNLTVPILSTVSTCLCGMFSPFLFALADLELGIIGEVSSRRHGVAGGN
jgi:hypothetical protein